MKKNLNLKRRTNLKKKIDDSVEDYKSLAPTSSFSPKKSSNTIPKQGMLVKRRKDDRKVMLDDDEAKKTIAEYMESQNRPYSIQNLMDNLGGRIRKVQTQRI